MHFGHLYPSDAKHVKGRRSLEARLLSSNIYFNFFYLTQKEKYTYNLYSELSIAVYIRYTGPLPAP